MRWIAAAVTLLLLTGTASAQLNLWANDPTKDPETVAKQKEIDDAYKAKMQEQKPAAAPANDPWGSVRANEAPAKTKTKTGSKTQ